MLVWRLQEFPTGPTGTSVKDKGILTLVTFSQFEQQQRSGPEEGVL